MLVNLREGLGATKHFGNFTSVGVLFSLDHFHKARICLVLSSTWQKQDGTAILNFSLKSTLQEFLINVLRPIAKEVKTFPAQNLTLDDVCNVQKEMAANKESENEKKDRAELNVQMEYLWY